jgi:outer membrane usher protein FimD/PapC
MTYLADGNLSARHLRVGDKTALLETFSYDLRGRLELQQNSGDDLPRDRFGNSIVRQYFEFDALDNVVYSRIDFKDGSHDIARFGFSAEDPCQLVHVTHSHADYQGLATDFTYDADGNLTLGEAFTGGDVFKSVPIRGVQIRSDVGMLPDVMQGYAPVIRGVALSRARLEVQQNGYPIYSTYVSAGPYEIDDLSTGGGSGELEVILTEADGQVRRFTQPYATLGNLLREGTWRYSATVGRYNAASHLDDPLMWQGTLALGSRWGSTVYGGVLAADYYRAVNVGVAKDLGSIGAVALDVTRSDAELDTRDPASTAGMSYAVKYGKTFPTRTSLRFAGYRYSTEGYRDSAVIVEVSNTSSLSVGYSSGGS